MFSIEESFVSKVGLGGPVLSNLRMLLHALIVLTDLVVAYPFKVLHYEGVKELHVI